MFLFFVLAELRLATRARWASSFTATARRELLTIETKP
jgi:hypothetical protein